MSTDAGDRGGVVEDASVPASAVPGRAPLRPLQPLLQADLRAYVAPELRLHELVAAPSFDAVKAYFTDYPHVGLSTPTGRALMFHIVRAMQPELVIEVGTYHGGMTEIIARALWENGAGRIVTIDPFGGDRVPPILARWPDALSSLVSYAKFNSMDLYMDFEQVRRPFDIGFIDGNHAYEFVYYDLISLAKWIRPGGVILADDPYQPGVFWAVKHFLERHPGWRELGGALQAWRASDPFHCTGGSVADSNFLILAAPPGIELGDRAVSFETPQFRERTLTGLELHLAPGNMRGILHAMVFLRSFGVGAGVDRPDQKMVTTKTMLDTDVSRRLLIPLEPMSAAEVGTTTVQSAEIVLYWQCDDRTRPLSLEGPPRPVVTD